MFYWIFTSILVPILVIGVLVFIHELGHFLVAKWCGVGVVRFAVGFGPAIFKYKRGETQYQIGVIPLGGFVRMVGDLPDMIVSPQDAETLLREGEKAEGRAVEEDPELARLLKDPEKWFIHKSLWQKSAIVFAGPLFNFILAFFVTSGIVYFAGQKVPQNDPVIGSVAEKSPAEIAGLRAGDIVTKVQGAAVTSWEALASEIRAGQGEQINLDIRRDGQEQSIAVLPLKKQIPGTSKPVYMIGIEASFVKEDFTILRAFEYGALWTINVTQQTYGGLWAMFSGEASLKDLRGPITILDAAGQQARQGATDVFYLLSFLSVTLAVLNLLPIPVLDGGHLMFFLLEGLLGPISLRKKELAQQVGVLMLISLMVIAFHNDIMGERIDTNAPKIKWEEKEASGEKNGNPPQTPQ